MCDFSVASDADIDVDSSDSDSTTSTANDTVESTNRKHNRRGNLKAVKV